MNTSLFERAKYLFITLSAVAVVFAIPTWAQDEDEDAAELGKIEVTGSRLNQTDIETAQPVTVISREQIELSFATVAEVLQNLLTTHLDHSEKLLDMQMVRLVLMKSRSEA